MDTQGDRRGFQRSGAGPRPCRKRREVTRGSVTAAIGGAAWRAAVLSIVAVLAGGIGCAPPTDEAETLRVCLEANPRDIDPRYGSDESSRRVHGLMHAGLTRNDETGAPVGDLARDWERISPTRYRFHLRDGLRFASGAPLTANDVRATLLSVASAGSTSFRHGDLKVIESVEVRSPTELEIRLSEPFAPLLANLNLGILPAAQAEAEEVDSLDGAGPYRLVEARPDQDLLLEANPHYWEGPPQTPRVRLRILPHETTRALELEKGTVDLVINDLPPDLVDRFAGDPAFRVETSPGAAYSYLGFNLADPTLAKLPVRRAIALGIDRDTLIRHLLRGRAVPASGLLPPGNWAYEPTPSPPYDPAAAIRLLEDAGYAAGADGIRLRLVYKTSTSELANQQAQVLQENLRQIGIAIEIRAAEWATFYDDVVNGRFQLYSLTWTEIVDPDVYRLRFASRYMPPEGLNRGRYHNERVDELLDAGLRSADREERRAVYAELQHILADELPYVSLWHRDNIAVARARVEGLRLTPTADFRALKDVRLRGAEEKR